MNLLHFKYALVIAETGSINKAAEKLFIGQPNLSRAIKELESSLGIEIFTRSSKGMYLTPEGEKFIAYAKSILKQVDDVEKMFTSTSSKKVFSISVPRASYVADAFSKFSNELSKNSEIEVFYKETNSMRSIKNILEENYNLAIIRYATNYDQYYKNMMDEKDFSYELITEFSYVLIVSKDSKLAHKQNISFDDLNDFTEIAHADPYVPSLPLSSIRKDELPDAKKVIFVFERAIQFELLNDNPDTFMWVSPVPKSLLDRYNLVQIKCTENKKVYKDVLIHKKSYVLSQLDKTFIEILIQSKRSIF